MASKQINGVGFNTDVVSKMSREKFLNHPMHEHHWTHLKTEDKPKAIAEAWEILNPFHIDDIESQTETFVDAVNNLLEEKTEEDVNTNTDGGEAAKLDNKDAGVVKRSNRRNKRKLSEPE